MITSKLVWILTGIKNEVKSLKIAFCSFLRSALAKNFEKGVGHLIFWIPFGSKIVWKISFSCFGYSLISNFCSKILTHIIFFSSEKWDIVLSNFNNWGPRARYFDVNIRYPIEKIIKNPVLSWPWGHGPPNRPPNKYQERNMSIVSLRKRLWTHF